jgi:hypothetical protein
MKGHAGRHRRVLDAERNENAEQQIQHADAEQHRPRRRTRLARFDGEAGREMTGVHYLRSTLRFWRSSHARIGTGTRKLARQKIAKLAPLTSALRPACA